MTIDVACCVEALEQACRRGQPAIFNPNQGARCTSQECTARLQHAQVQINLEGRGRALDHVFVERLWRTVKYEQVYVREYQSVWDARQSLEPLLYRDTWRRWLK